MPCIIAHGPPTSLILLATLLFLALGALVPPMLYLRATPSATPLRRSLRIGAAILLNAYGFLIYCNAAWALCETATDSAAPLFLAVLLFIGVESYCIRKRRQALARQGRRIRNMTQGSKQSY